MIRGRAGSLLLLGSSLVWRSSLVSIRIRLVAPSGGAGVGEADVLVGGGVLVDGVGDEGDWVSVCGRFIGSGVDLVVDMVVDLVVGDGGVSVSGGWDDIGRVYEIK